MTEAMTPTWVWLGIIALAAAIVCIVVAAHRIRARHSREYLERRERKAPLDFPRIPIQRDDRPAQSRRHRRKSARRKRAS